MWKLDATRDSMSKRKSFDEVDSSKSTEYYLKNKANSWSSEHKWNMIVKDEFIIMKNISTNKALTIGENEIEVIEDILNEDNIRQMWIKGMYSKDNYFTLSNSTSEKFLTATPDGLIISFGKKLLCT